MIHYYDIAKPGIVYANAITAAAGYFFAARGHIDWIVFCAMLAGVSLSIASAAVFNNVIDRDIDAKMERTKNRATVTGKMSLKEAKIYAALLGIFGFALLYFYTNAISIFVLFIGYITYIVIYGYFKRRSTFFTYAGAIAGAVPPVVGYTAVTADLDWGALVLFLILFSWQMAHFYAIAINRRDEYVAAGIPIYSAVMGMQRTRDEMLMYIFLFAISILSVTLIRDVPQYYVALAAGVGGLWTGYALYEYFYSDDKTFATRMFLCSLVALVSISAGLSLS